MTRRTVAFGVVLLSALPCISRADEPRLRVFYTGHSFHMFVPARVGLAAKAAGVTEYQFAGTQGIGGSRVIQHWDKDKGDNPARKALEKGDVDVFTMAPHLKIPDEGIDHFVELGLKHNPKMRFLVQQSWVPFDFLEKRVKDNAERDAAQLDVDKLAADHAKWRGEMEAQVKTLNKKAGRDAVCIVPAGDAVVKLRALVALGKAPGIAKQSELFTDAIGHGKPPVVILVSYCNYACITGKSPVGLKVKEPAISDELHELLQRIAWETVSNYAMSGVTGVAKTGDAKTGEAKTGDTKTRLSRALTLHASFDDGLDADFSRGDKNCYALREDLVKAVPTREVRLARDAGRFGAALHFIKKNTFRPAFKNKDVLGYNDKSWSASVSVWLRLDPDTDLEPGYCDPVQIIGDDVKKGFIFLEWSKEKPRFFRYAIRPLQNIWNPDNLGWEEVKKKPMVQVERAPFARDAWTHVVFTLDNINDKSKPSSGRLYLNGKLQGAIEKWDLTFGWNPDRAMLVLGAAYVGHLDDLAVFNRALTDEEVREVFGLKGGVRELR